MLSKLFTTALTVFLGGLIIAATPTVAADFTVKVAYETSETHLKARTAALFAKELEQRSGGRVEVQIFPNASLLPSKQEVNAAIRGQVQVILPFLSYYESIAPSVKVFTMPMVFADYDHLAKAWQGKAGDQIRKDLDKVGLRALAFWYETPTQLFTTGKKVTNLDELKGLKIRTYPSALLESTLTNLGAVATVIPGSEVYLALQNNTVDGAITTPSFAASLKLTEVLKTMTQLGLAYGGYILAVNKDFYDKLPADLQKAVNDSARVASEWNGKEIDAEVKKSNAAMLEAGVKVFDLDKGDRKRWVAAVQPVFQEQDDSLKALIDAVK